MTSKHYLSYVQHLILCVMHYALISVWSCPSVFDAVPAAG